MEERLEVDFRHGDKVRVRTGDFANQRGVVLSSSSHTALVALEGADPRDIRYENLTNYSLAARKAWANMPKRSGRPKLQAPRKKMVSLRLDVELVELLSLAVEQNLSDSKEELVARALRDYFRAAGLALPFHGEKTGDVQDEQNAKTGS